MEFEYRVDDFQAVAKRAYELAGIVLGDNKKSLVYSRLSRRIRRLELTSFQSYLQYLAEHDSEEQAFINAMTTNLTRFFRESHHFEFLTKVVKPGWRIWSAGCSTGEEPWSIALTLAHANSLAGALILASDIDTQVVEQAQSGVYELETPTPDWFATYQPYLQLNRAKGQFRVRPEIAQVLRFRQLNLLTPWPMKKQLDVVFCRNVMIYFDDQTRLALAKKFINQIKPGGYLIIGHSESLHRFNLPIRSIGPTIYQVEK